MENHTNKSVHQMKNEEARKGLAEITDRLTSDRYRLNYHFMPPAGWMNDPNGLIQYKGEYHVFYQHDPFRCTQGPMHWGHAKSKNLLKWEHLPVALSPSEIYDMVEFGIGGGCWSGSAVEKDGKLILVYTGHVDGRSPIEVQCLAVSEDGIQFEKPEVNPVIAGPLAADCFGFRDPKVWKHGDTWYMVVGYGHNGSGKALLYSSSDLLNWTYKGVAAESDGTMGDMWECPDLFPIGNSGEHILIISPMNMGDVKTMYLSGAFDYETGTLTTKVAERLDYGFDFYAPQTFLDDQGRRILFAWMNIWGATMPEQAYGWSGAFTIPREIKLEEDGTIRMQPVEELKQLRGEHYWVGPVLLGAHTTHDFEGIAGDSLEMIIHYEVDTSSQGEFGLRVRCSSDMAEYTEIRYQVCSQCIQVDRIRSGEGDTNVSETQIGLMEDGKLKLHLFMDRSSLELFINDGQKTLTNRIYPKIDSLGVEFFSRNGSVQLESLQVWELKSVW